MRRSLLFALALALALALVTAAGGMAAGPEPAPGPRALCLFCSDAEATQVLTPDRRPVRPRFWEAVGGVVLMEAVPATFNRITDEPWSRISLDSAAENIREGFHYDPDRFFTNQIAHPYHGSLFFNSARSNGYGFWASGAFALAGSLVWECCMETSRPSFNDLVNTTLGGMALGEVSHRLATVMRDNEATGRKRFWREVGGLILDPMGGLERLLHGEWKTQFNNPEERFPRGFEVAAAMGYRHVEDGSERESSALISLSAAYGDPFLGEIDRPFDSFWIEGDLAVPSREVVTRVQGRGILKGWDVSAAGSRLDTILGFWLQYEYLQNESQVFGAQGVNLGLLARRRVAGITATGDLAAVVFPLAGVRTLDLPEPDTDDPELRRRTYDYAPGAGLRAGLRLDARFASLAAAYGNAWLRTVDGPADTSTLQFLRVSVRVPLVRTVGLGAGWAWYSRQTTYPGPFREPRMTQTEWRLFASWSLDQGAPDPKTPLPQ